MILAENQMVSIPFIQWISKDLNQIVPIRLSKLIGRMFLKLKMRSLEEPLVMFIPIIREEVSL